MKNVFTKVIGIEKSTLLDFPGKLSCILFSGGCSMKCPYCYNKNLLSGDNKTIDPNLIFSFINSRKGILDGVVFSGGECTIHKDYLIDSAQWCKDNGLAVKIDTNGTFPNVVKEMVQKNLVDYIALDYKYPNIKNEYMKFHDNTILRNRFEETLNFLIKDSNIAFETRTTIHPDITSEEVANEILRELEQFGYNGTHYFQFFNECEETIGNVNQFPRRFDVSKLITPKNISLVFRNDSSNNRRPLK